MILVCPSCSTSYLTEVQFPPEGRKVRCAKCSHVWRAMPDDDAMPVEAPPHEPAAEEPSRDPQPAEGAHPKPDEDHQQATADAQSSVDEQDLESADERADESDAPDAEPEKSAAPDPDPEISDARDAAPDESAAPAPEPEISDAPSEEDDAFDDDSDIVFNEPEQPQAKTEAEPPSVKAAQAEPAVDDTSEPEDEAVFDEPASGEDDEPSDAVDAEWAVDEEPDAAPTGIATTQIEPESTGLAVNPAAVAVSPTSQVVEATAEEVFVARDHGPKRRGGAGLAIAWVALILVIGGAGFAAYIFRFDIVRSIPAVAQVYRAVGIPANARGLEIRDLAYSWEVESTRAVLIVQGQVVNITGEPLEVPQLVLALRDQAFANLREIPANVGLRAPLQPGAEAQFRVRILAPPETTSNVFVRFAEAR